MMVLCWPKDVCEVTALPLPLQIHMSEVGVSGCHVLSFGVVILGDNRGLVVTSLAAHTWRR